MPDVGILKDTAVMRVFWIVCLLLTSSSVRAIAQGNDLDSLAIWTSDDDEPTNCMAWGDVDSDGDLDLMCGGALGLTLYYNAQGVLEQTARWRSRESYEVLDMAWADIDSDGNLDFVTAGYNLDSDNHRHDTVRIYYGSNDFLSTSAQWSYHLASGVTAIALGDYNNDGSVDLACGGKIPEYDSTIHYFVFDNTGGEFELQFAWSSPDKFRGAGSAEWADFDQDGDIDLFCAPGYMYDLCRIYENNGGVLAHVAKWSPSEFIRAEKYLIGDITGNGFEDIIIIDDVYSDVHVYVNVGGWTIPYLSQVPFDIPMSGWAELADIDRDGDLDFIVPGAVIRMQSGVPLADSIWMAQENGSFGPMACGDINSDGYLEIADGSIYNEPKKLFGRHAQPVIDTLPTLTSAVAHRMRQMILADIDNDGDLDLAAASFDSTVSHVALNTDGVFGDDRLVLYNGGGTVASADCDGNGFTDIAFDLGNSHIGIFLNDHGFFGGEPDIVVAAGGSISIKFGDLTGNDYPDMVWRSEESLYVHYNTSGNFDSLPTTTIDLPSYVPAKHYIALNVELADMDKDGDLDVITDGIYLNDGGVINPEPSWLPERDVGSVAIGDIDGNGYPDVVSAPSLLYDVGYVFFNDRGIVSATPGWTSSDGTGYEVRCLDLENDGDLDLVFTGANTRSKIYLNDNEISRTAAFTFGTSPLTDHDQAIAVGDVDLDGDIDIVTHGIMPSGSGFQRAYMVFENNKVLDCTPGGQIPNAATCAIIRGVEASPDQAGIIEIGVELIDKESDVCNITLQYSEMGGGSWTAARSVENADNLSSSPGGVLHDIIWDTEFDGVDGYDVWLRLKVESMPIHGEPIQYPAQFLLRSIGRIDNRPRIAVVYPRTYSVVADSLQVLGRIWDATNFSNYSIKLGELPDTLEWVSILESDTPVRANGAMATVDLSDRNAGEYLLRFEAADFNENRNIRDIPITVTTTSPRAPSVTRSYPPPGSDIIPGNAPVVVQFDQNMNESSLDNSAIVLYSELGETYANSQYDYASKTLTLFPDREYTSQQFHYFVVGSRLLNEQGIAMGGEFVSYFTSAGGSPTSEIDSLSPFRGQTEVSVNLDSLRIYYIGRSFHRYVKIFDLKGNVVVNDTVEGEWFPGSVKLPPMSPKTYYLVRISDSPTFDGESDYMSYFITEDTQLPVAVDYEPDDRAWLVGLDSPVRVLFNKPMNTFSVDATSFSVTGPTGAVPGVYEFGEEDSTVATFYADEPLKPGTEFRVLLTDHIQDNLGNPIAPTSWTFTTGVFGTASYDGSVVSSAGVEVSFPLGAIDPDVEVGLGRIPSDLVPLEEGLDFTGVAYEIRPAMGLQRKAILTVTLPDSLFTTGSEQYSFYFRDASSGSWQYIGGTQSGHSLKSSIDRLGTYGVFASRVAGIASTDLQGSLSLLPRVISPRTGGVNSRLSISFRVGEPTGVTARIYDTSGRLVKTLSAGSVAQIGENLLSWDGRTDHGEYATDGLHVVVIEAAGQRAQKTFVILNK
jgi:hypothetical protein